MRRIAAGKGRGGVEVTGGEGYILKRSVHSRGTKRQLNRSEKGATLIRYLSCDILLTATTSTAAKTELKENQESKF